MPYVYCGDVDIVLATPSFHPPLTDEEARDVAEALASELTKKSANLFAKYPGVTLTFEVESASYGCVRMRLVMMLGGALVGLVQIIAVWGDFREQLPHFLQDVSQAFNCVVRRDQIQCDELTARWRAVEQLYQVQAGDTLSEIVINVWRIPHVQQHKVMRWVVKNNPHAFINGDIHRIKVGALIGRPTDTHLRGIMGN